MKILLTSIGTRGDIEPFLALGELLQSQGHQIQYAFPAQFAHLVNPQIEFLPLSPRMLELIESEEGKIVMGKAPIFSKVKALFHLYRKGKSVNELMVQQQFEWIQTHQPDMIIHNPKCTYPFLWGLKTLRPTILLSPIPYFIHYVEGHAHIGINKNMGSLLNRWSYKLSNYGLVTTIYDSQKWISETKSFSKAMIKQKVVNQKMIYTISPTLFKRPDHWEENVQIVGYHERDKGIDWKPSSALEDFLNHNEKVLFLTFGSMENNDSEQLSQFMYEVLSELNIPTLVNTASGGLKVIPKFKANDQFFFVDQLPYDWILKRVYAIVHHGGSGTTHSGLKYGCPTLIIPHIIDQFGWNEIVHTLGVGPRGVSVNKLSASSFRVLVKDIFENLSYKKRAEEVAHQMKEEQLEEFLIDFIVNDDRHSIE